MRLLAALFALFLSVPASADLAGYVARLDPAFTWSVLKNDKDTDGTRYRLSLVSQTWRGIDWKHDLHLFVPARADVRHALLFIGGSTRGDDDGPRALALRLRAPVAVLTQVPNQPLFDDLYEDDLIAETFVRFLRTGEEDWPLLLPMTKSAVRAMDALQAFSRERLQRPIERFVLTGASKRGWTSWLAAAVDPRVSGVAPRVIDMLNVPAQLPHQLASWGRYSEMLSSYTEPGLPQFIATPPGRRLLALVDPYSYRDRLGMPKLIVLGTNDRYWTLDALNLYWDALPGEKRVLYVPNAGHGLAGDEPWTDTLACFFRSVASGQPLPAPTFSFEQRDGALRLRVEPGVPALEATVWHASAPSRDFREATWRAQAMQPAGGAYAGEAPLTPGQYDATLVTLRYDVGGERCALSSRVTIVEP